MKKILSVLSIIYIFTIISTNIIACNITNKNIKNNKPIKQTKLQFTPQQPPTNSNWKLMSQATTNRLSHPNYLNIADNKNYVFIYNNDIPKNYKIIRIINDGFKYPSNVYKFIRDYITEYSTYWNAIVKASYRWDGNYEPQLPTINKNTGKIINWNEKKES